jgi:hypothetical protein
MHLVSESAELGIALGAVALAVFVAARWRRARS